MSRVRITGAGGRRNVSSRVARIWCKEEHENKVKAFKGDTQKYYKIHAVNSYKATGLYILFWVGNRIESNVRVCAALK